MATPTTLASVSLTLGFAHCWLKCLTKVNELLLLTQLNILALPLNKSPTQTASKKSSIIPMSQLITDQ